MTNLQLYLAIGVPMLFNAILFVVLLAYINARFDAVNARFDARFDAVNTRFEGVNTRFESINERFAGVNQRLDAMNQRFDDMRDLWRAELHRVEEVIDARLKHLEDR